MKVSSVISELKTKLHPYLIFWDEWVLNENCNLTQEEINTVNFYIQNNFEVNLFDKLFFQDKAEKVIKISVKLNIAQRVYKEWVVVKFLFTIVEMAKAYGYDIFLNTPINQLVISEEIKAKLGSFKVYTLQQLFIIYKSEDFARAWLYNNIIDFLIMHKELQKPISLKSL
jgi:hypothetical protein